MGKRLLSVVLLIAIMCTMLPYVSISVSATDTPQYEKAVLNIDLTKIRAVGCQKGGQACACFSLAYCTTILDGSVHYYSEYNLGTSQADAICDWSAGGYLNNYFPTSISDAYKTLYDQVVSGNPVVVKVAGTRSSHHYVAVVGVENVTTYEALTAANFLILDPAVSVFNIENMGAVGYDLKMESNVYQVVRNGTGKTVSLNSIEYTCAHDDYNNLGVCSGCGEEFDFAATFTTTSAGDYEVSLSGGIYLRTQKPYAAATERSSLIQEGTEVEVLGHVTNAFDNVWYKVSYNGTIGYTSVDNLTWAGVGAQEISCVLTSPAEGATVPKAAYPVIGTVTSKYPLKEVAAYIDGTWYATVTLGNTSTLDLRSSDINQKLDFASLSTGIHTLTIKAHDIHHDLITVCTRKFYTEVGDNLPIATCDEVTGGEGSIYIRGWAFDPDTLDESVSIHVYIDGVMAGSCTANTSRSDVDDVYGCGNYHGFSATIPYDVSTTGTHSVTVYALNTTYGKEATSMGPYSVTITAHTHSYTGKVTTAATCVTDGVRTYTCCDCGASYTESISATGSHNYVGRVTSEAYCGGTGTMIYTCSGCSDSYTESISATGDHSWRAWNTEKAATCIETGTQSRQCTVCAETQTQTIALTDHTPTTYPGYAATCTTPGLTDCIYCNYCGKILTRETQIPATGHSYENGLCTACGLGEEPCGGNLTWVLNNKGVLTISGTGEMYDYDWGNTPWYPRRDKITAVIISEGIISIGQDAFSGCNMLKTVSLPDSLQRIGNWAFYFCDLADITLPESLTVIGIQAFAENTYLGEIVIPANVTTIGQNAFQSCHHTFFNVNPDNPYFSSDDKGVLFNKDKSTLIRASGQLSGNYDVPDSVRFIGNYAFYDNQNMTSVTIPESVRSIEMSAFESCHSLKSVTLSGMTSIQFKAFFDCSSLTSVTIPDSVRAIGEWAFSFCSSLTNVKLPASLTVINNYAFYECDSLTTVTIPDGVVLIGESAFAGCGRLKSVVIPDSVTSIGDSAFISCGLTSVTIPNGVTSISSYAFQNCNNLNCIIFTGAAPSISSRCFTNVTANAYYPEGESSWTDDVKQSYGGTLTWIAKDVEDCIAGGTCGENLTWILDNNGVLSIFGTGAMTDYEYQDLPWGDYREAIKKAVLEDGVASIGDYAFCQCVNLTSVTIPDSVTSIGLASFLGCTNLPLVNIPDSVTSIGLSGFSACGKLTSISIPDSVTSIGDYAFNGCSGLKTAVIGKGVVEIGDRPFDACSSLTEILVSAENPYFSNDDRGVLFNKDKSILIQAPGALAGDYSIPDSVNSIRDYAFCACVQLTSVSVPGSVSNIGDAAFYLCGNLVSVTIHDGVTGIGTGAFSRCGKLSTVIYCGTSDQWSTIAIETDNDFLLSAERVYHNWTEASCTTPKMCMICEETDGEAFGHSWTEATCTAPKTCAVCGATEGEALGHSGDQWVEILAPTCTVDGINARICSVCNATETVTVNALGHSNETVVTAPTCTEQGYTTNTCSVCGEVTVTDYVDAKGHNWSAWIQTKAPSCTEEGSQTRFCNCGARETQTIAKSHTCENGICTACGVLGSYYWVLTADANVEIALEQDLYVDLNGYDLSGTITTNGYQVYGMDSTTNLYTYDSMGYFSCVDENGQAIVPVRQFKTDAEMTGDIRRYMAISTDSGYTFHRFYLGITNTSLKPDTISVGYKAVFYGDDMVKAQLYSFGYTMQLGSFNAVSQSKAADSFVSGKTVTLRINNYDAENYGETTLYASVYLQLSDGTTIQSAEYSVTLKDMVESINTNYIAYNADQLALLQTMITNNPTMQSWTVDNIYTKES